jgi:tetratricopeptide (TPR) repeat protein
MSSDSISRTPGTDLPANMPVSAGTAIGAQPWTRMPYRDVPRLTVADISANWARLHAGQGLQPPAPGPLAEGWALYHSGEFEQAAAIGLAHGSEGLALANQAIAVYANYLEPREAIRRQLFRQVIERATAQAQAEVDNCPALYWQAYALGRYSQGVSVARALAQGLGGRVKGALERVIALQPQHADAHVALGTFHAEVIDKVGALVGRMTYGVRADVAVEHYERGLELNPQSAIALMEYARGKLMLHGDACLGDATRLYERAAAIEPVDARERLDVELAKAGISV